MNLDRQKHSNCKDSENSKRLDTKMGLDIDKCRSSNSQTFFSTIDDVQMNQCLMGDSNVKCETVDSSSSLLTVERFYSTFNSRINYLVNSFKNTLASPLSGICSQNLLQEGIFKTIRSVSLLKYSVFISNMALYLGLLTLALSLCQTEGRSVGLCRGVPCANGGTLMVDNSVWGHCRCRCRSGFVGPYCQYQLIGKRSVGSTTQGGARRRITRSEKLEKIKQQLLDLTPNVVSSRNSEKGHSDPAMKSDYIRDEFINILQAQNSIDDSTKYDSISDLLLLVNNVRR